MTPATLSSVWLMPSGQVYNELSNTISQLSSQHGTPAFPPHVTLIPNLTWTEQELSIQTRQLASCIAPFEIVLTNIDGLDEYFRCLFLRIEETPALLEANRTARIIFHREKDPIFTPHLSLMYGNVDPKVKRQIANSIGVSLNKIFSVRSIHLFSTTGEPGDWYRLQEFEIHPAVQNVRPEKQTNV